METDLDAAIKRNDWEKIALVLYPRDGSAVPSDDSDRCSGAWKFGSYQ